MESRLRIELMTLQALSSPSSGRSTSWSAVLGLAMVVMAADAQDKEQEPDSTAPASAAAIAESAPTGDSALVFSTEEWNGLEAAIDKGLARLAEQQNENGSFGDSSSGQPALTALATMAFLSRGHQSGGGPYGALIDRSIDYVLASQDRLGFFVAGNPYKSTGTTYSHAISGVMLAEVLGMTDRVRNERVTEALRHALDATAKLQYRHHQNTTDRGGWRYLYNRSTSRAGDSDLSVTTWHLLFLRAAKNAGFAVPQQLVTDAAAFVRRCYDPDSGMFCYLPNHRNSTITMTAAGALCLTLSGQLEDPTLKKARQAMGDYDFARSTAGLTWPYYTCYHSSQAASQAGGPLRRHVLRGIAAHLLREQTSTGEWPTSARVGSYGTTYTTAMAILSLTPAYQILPIYQQ